MNMAEMGSGVTFFQTLIEKYSRSRYCLEACGAPFASSSSPWRRSYVERCSHYVPFTRLSTSCQFPFPVYLMPVVSLMTSDNPVSETPVFSLRNHTLLRCSVQSTVTFSMAKYLFPIYCGVYKSVLSKVRSCRTQVPICIQVMNTFQGSKVTRDPEAFKKKAF